MLKVNRTKITLWFYKVTFIKLSVNPLSLLKLQSDSVIIWCVIVLLTCASNHLTCGKWLYSPCSFIAGFITRGRLSIGIFFFYFLKVKGIELQHIESTHQDKIDFKDRGRMILGDIVINYCLVKKNSNFKILFYIILKYQVFEHFPISLYSSQGLSILYSLKMATAL